MGQPACVHLSWSDSVVRAPLAAGPRLSVVHPYEGSSSPFHATRSVCSAARICAIPKAHRGPHSWPRKLWRLMEGAYRERSNDPLCSHQPFLSELLCQRPAQWDESEGQLPCKVWEQEKCDGHAWTQQMLWSQKVCDTFADRSPSYPHATVLSARTVRAPPSSSDHHHEPRHSVQCFTLICSAVPQGLCLVGLTENHVFQSIFLPYNP